MRRRLYSVWIYLEALGTHAVHTSSTGTLRVCVRLCLFRMNTNTNITYNPYYFRSIPFFQFSLFVLRLIHFIHHFGSIYVDERPAIAFFSCAHTMNEYERERETDCEKNRWKKNEFYENSFHYENHIFSAGIWRKNEMKTNVRPERVLIRWHLSNSKNL